MMRKPLYEREYRGYNLPEEPEWARAQVGEDYKLILLKKKDEWISVAHGYDLAKDYMNECIKAIRVKNFNLALTMVTECIEVVDALIKKVYLTMSLWGYLLNTSGIGKKRKGSTRRSGMEYYDESYLPEYSREPAGNIVSGSSQGFTGSDIDFTRGLEKRLNDTSSDLRQNRIDKKTTDHTMNQMKNWFRYDDTPERIAPDRLKPQIYMDGWGYEDYDRAIIMSLEAARYARNLLRANNAQDSVRNVLQRLEGWLISIIEKRS